MIYVLFKAIRMNTIKPPFPGSLTRRTYSNLDLVALGDQMLGYFNTF